MRLILVFLVLLAIRITAFQMGLPVTDTEITWFLTGERMASGFTLYKDIWTELEPLSAGFYYFINLIYKNSTTLNFWLSLFLVYAQALLLADGLNKNKIFKFNTSLPALFYVLFTSLFFDFYTLSPVLLGTTFLLMAFNIMCVQTRVMTGEDDFFYIGVLIGIASLFYFPFTLFIIFALVALGLYSITSLKKQFILLVAFLFPYIILFIYYFWIDNLGNYFRYALEPIVNSAPILKVNFMTISKILVLPILLFLMSSFAIVALGKFLHYQYKIIKIAGFWFLCSILALFLEKSITPHSFIMMAPPLAIFSSFLFLLLYKNKIFREFLFFSIFGGILLISFYALKRPDQYTKANLIVTPPEVLSNKGIKNKNIIVFGNDKSYYFNNSIAGPYLNWKFSAVQFSSLENYDNVSEIYEVFEINKPDYIIDQVGLMSGLSEKIPSIKKLYVQVDSSVVYQRMNNY